MLHSRHFLFFSRNPRVRKIKSAHKRQSIESNNMYCAQMNTCWDLPRKSPMGPRFPLKQRDDSHRASSLAGWSVAYAENSVSTSVNHSPQEMIAETMSDREPAALSENIFASHGREMEKQVLTMFHDQQPDLEEQFNTAYVLLRLWDVLQHYLCGACGRIATRRCSLCWQKYCNRVCQAAHWKSHKRQCKGFNGRVGVCFSFKQPVSSMPPSCVHCGAECAPVPRSSLCHCEPRMKDAMFLFGHDMDGDYWTLVNPHPCTACIWREGRGPHCMKCWLIFSAIDCRRVRCVCCGL